MSTVYTGQSSLIEAGLFLPLRFYDSLDQQERFKPLSEGVSNNYSYVYVDSLSLIPFQIHTEGYKVSVHAICVDTGEEIDLPNIEAATNSEGGSGLQMTIYHGDATDVLEPNALYYLKIVFSESTVYSDIFKTLPDDPGSNFVKIKYKNTVAVGDIEYDDFATSSYTNWCWLDADIHKPTYPIRRESKENDRGDIRHSFQRWDKVYTMEIWVNEVMADFLSLIPIHDSIEITFNGFTATCYDFAFDPKWESISSVALATITFSTKSVILSGYKGTC